MGWSPATSTAWGRAELDPRALPPAWPHRSHPLWQQSREALLADLLTRGIVAHLSCVDTRVLAPEWVGRTLDAATLAELQQLAASRASMPAASRGVPHHGDRRPGLCGAAGTGRWQVARQQQLAYLLEDEG